MAHAVTRIFLAMYLVLWAPALCCCAIRGSLGTVTGIGGASCEADQCCTRTEKKPTSRESCCAVEADDALAKRPSNSPCKCHDVGNDRVRFDTSFKLSLVDISPAFIAIPAPVLFVPGLAEDGFSIPVSAQLDLPPPTALLAQHCLLTI